MAMSILVVGERGMLGQAVCQAVIEAGHTLIAPHSRDAVSQVIINCIGVIPSRMRELEYMIHANAVLPHLLVERHKDQHVVHVSTDCVFSGGVNKLHTVLDVPDPIDLYGASKRAGEISMFTRPNVTVVRTSFIGRKHGLLPWLLDSTGDVPGWTNAIWSGSLVEIVARKIVDVATGWPRGIIHIAAPAISKYDVLVAIKEAMSLDNVNIVPTDYPRIYRGLEPTPGFELPWFGSAVLELAR